MLVEMFSKIFFRKHIYWDVFENLTFGNLPAIQYKAGHLCGLINLCSPLKVLKKLQNAECRIELMRDLGLKVDCTTSCAKACGSLMAVLRTPVPFVHSC